MSKIGYVSTRQSDQDTEELQVDAAVAIAKGLAPDGGLYMPLCFPQFAVEEFESCDTLAQVAAQLIRPFVVGSVLEDDIQAICEEAFNFPMPLVSLVPKLSADSSSDNTASSNSSNPYSLGKGELGVLELFHGPTAAFKDVGARFLAACMERIEHPLDGGQRLRILVATSGDTGGAVAAAFHGRERVDVDVFFPAGQVSSRQEQQLTCWGDNIRAFKVDGRFDDCQSLVKAVFQDAELGKKNRFSSANSINLGRLLPQMVYYAYTSLKVHRESGVRPSFIVPTGNLGNALACVWARRVGMPIDEVVLATNANQSIPDYLSTGKWQPRQSIATLASAMDVGNPSNMERLSWMFKDLDQVRHQVSALVVNDKSIQQQIKKDRQRYGQIWCPHTATALYAYDQLSDGLQSSKAWVAVATAHPAKFDTIVEPLIGEAVDIPKALAELLELPSHSHQISAQLDELRGFYH